MAETPDKETQGDNPPPAALQGASSRVPAIMVSLAALAIVGAATANSLPNFDRFSLPNFSLPSFSLPNFSRFSLPNVSWPDFSRFVAQPAHHTASVPIPEPPISTTLRGIQLSQQQNAAVLVSLTQSSATQLADLKRMSRQLASLTALVESLQGAVAPLTTSSIPHSNPRARIIRRSRKIIPLPKPVGPVSVGGAPLSPAPASVPASNL